MGLRYLRPWAAIAIVAVAASTVQARSGAAERQAGEPAAGAKVVFLGDSLTAGFGLEVGLAFPAVLEESLRETGHRARVVNAGVSGDTSAGGLRRLDWLLKQDPDVLVVGLGANDGLRGIPVEETERNLRAIVAKARRRGASVLLLGMRIPPSYGPEYAGEFAEVYTRVARDLEVPLVPFLLEGVAGRPEWNLSDGIHPNAEGHARVAATVLPILEPLVAAAARRR